MIPKLRRYLLAIAAMLSCVAGTVSAQEDSCSDVLRIGLRDSFMKVTSNTLAKAVYDWACSSEARDYSNKTSFAATIPLPDFPAPVGGKFSSEDVDKWQKSHCEQHW